MATKKTSEALKREREQLRQKMKEAAAKEKQLNADIKKLEAEEKAERNQAVGRALEDECRKLGVDAAFDKELAKEIASFIVKAGFFEEGE